MPKISQTKNKIKQFVDSSNSQYYGVPIVVSQRAIDNALEAVSLAEKSSYLASDAYPFPEGGIQLVLLRDGQYVEIEINPDGSADFYVEKNGVVLEEIYGLSFASVKKKIEA